VGKIVLWILGGVAVLFVVGAIVGGDSDDASQQPSGNANPMSDAGAPPEPDSGGSAPAAPASRRQRIRSCLEKVGYTTNSPGPTMIRVYGGDGRPRAVILRYGSAAAADKSAADGREEGIETASFGRYEVNYFNEAEDPGSSHYRVISDCVANPPS
jgi:hypothetical protein